MRSLLIVGAFLTSFPFLVLSQKCPPPEDIMPCRCRGRNDQIQVWCSHSDLERVNGALENLMKLRSIPAIDELIVENNRMASLPARAFGALRIGRLLLRNNGLESVSRNAFAGLEESIEELYIVEDKLSDFPFDSIENLKNLEAFTVEKSLIRLLPRFNGLNRLKHIRIDGSLISGFPVGAFASMASVKQIHVVNSNVGSLAVGIFGPLETLLLANFSGNRIDLIQRKSFALLPKLEVLSLANNKIEDAIAVGRAASDLISLKSLDVSHNEISSLPEGSFLNLRNLQILNLAHNSIHNVNQRSFTHLPSLRKVDLSSNGLKSLPRKFFDATPQLEELRMRNNLLGTITEIGEMLQNLKSLKFLDLGENGIEEVPTGVLHDHFQLQRIDLSDNKITKILRSGFKNLPALVEMSFQNNSLSELSTDDWELPSLKELDLSNNNLPSLPPNSMHGLPTLIRLDLSYNSLKAISSRMFGQNKDLELIDLSGNGINAFSSDSLASLSKLTKLDLSRNHLEILPQGSFKDLKSLQFLNLGNNRINNVPGNLFESTRSLEELSFKSNLINSLPVGIFANLDKLRDLNLKHNSISEIPSSLLQPLKGLENLKLSSNQITRFDDSAFNELEKLKSLDLSSNRIQRISGKSFKNLPLLEKFEARENRIMVVEQGTLEESEQLQVLDLANNALKIIPDILKTRNSIKVGDLSHNQIEKVDFNSFKRSTGLVELYLNDNKIKALPGTAFENLTSLTILDLDGNEIEEVQSSTFKNLPKLIYLRMSRNKIRGIRSSAFLELPALDGLDLQENELESIAGDAFDKTSALKYLNLSHNHFDNLNKLGLLPLASLEVLDTSFNKIRDVDDKAIRHLQWLVELRLNDNGICRLAQGLFDGMSRLKMLVLRNNHLTNLYEAAFFKLKNNIAFLDISGNPLSCDCNLIWLRNLMGRDGLTELTESSCESPKEYKGSLLKSLRPSRMHCSDNNLRLAPLKYDENSCPQMTVSKKKRPSRLQPEERPHFGTYPQEDYYANDDDPKHKRKDEKQLESNDYIPGDTPTIYAGSGHHDRFHSNLQVHHEDTKKSTNGFGGISTLFGIPLDFGLNLGISPSFILSEKTTDPDANRGFAPGIKGPDPLPSSWVERPSKADFSPSNGNIYEPPEYIPRKPKQPYIPLNPYSDAKDRRASSNLLANPSSAAILSRPQSTVKFPSSSSSGSSSAPQIHLTDSAWNPSFPGAETGFIPIEPFFHHTREKNESRNREEVYKTNSRFQSYIEKVTIQPPYEYQPSSGHPERDWETTLRPLTYYSSSVSPLSEYEDESHNFAPVDLHHSDDDGEMSREEEDILKNGGDGFKKGGENNFSISDFWTMFTGKNESKDDVFSLSSPIIPPVNFSAPIDNEGLRNEENEGEKSPDALAARRPIGRPKITKITLEENFKGANSIGGFSPSKINEDTVSSSNDEAAASASSTPSQIVPPVMIGSNEAPLDWYYTNYHKQPNHGEELEKYLERRRSGEDFYGAESRSRSAANTNSGTENYNKCHFPIIPTFLFFYLFASL